MNDVKELINKFKLKPYPHDRGMARDLICPNCGNRDQFKISGVCVAVIDGEGYIHEVTGYEFHDRSLCLCFGCDKEDDVSVFKAKGLDAELSKVSNVSNT